MEQFGGEKIRWQKFLVVEVYSGEIFRWWNQLGGGMRHADLWEEGTVHSGPPHIAIFLFLCKLTLNKLVAGPQYMMGPVEASWYH